MRKDVKNKMKDDRKDVKRCDKNTKKCIILSSIWTKIITTLEKNKMKGDRNPGQMLEKRCEK